MRKRPPLARGGSVVGGDGAGGDEAAHRVAQQHRIGGGKVGGVTRLYTADHRNALFRRSLWRANPDHGPILASVALPARLRGGGWRVDDA